MVRTLDGPGSPSAAPPPSGTPTVLWDFDGTLVARDGNWRAALLTALDRVAADHGVTLEMLRMGLRDDYLAPTRDAPPAPEHTRGVVARSRPRSATRIRHRRYG